MTTATTTATTAATTAAAPIRQTPSFFARLGDFFVAYMESQTRADRITKLQALSDGELAQRGLTRDGIVGHVFSDRLYL